jgi:hypothetical protein
LASPIRLSDFDLLQTVQHKDESGHIVVRLHVSGDECCSLVFAFTPVEGEFAETCGNKFNVLCCCELERLDTIGLIVLFEVATHSAAVTLDVLHELGLVELRLLQWVQGYQIVSFLSWVLSRSNFEEGAITDFSAWEEIVSHEVSWKDTFVLYGHLGLLFDLVVIAVASVFIFWFFFCGRREAFLKCVFGVFLICVHMRFSICLGYFERLEAEGTSELVRICSVFLRNSWITDNASSSISLVLSLNNVFLRFCHTYFV